MFAIIMPVALGPSIATLFYLDSRAQKSGISKMTSRNATSQVTVEEDSLEAKTENEPKEEATISTVDKPPKETWTQGFVRIWHEMDAFGLILLGFGWSLLLLPFSLKTYAKHGWKNPSLIAMIIVGGVLLIAYVVYEINWAKFPSAPRRLVMNRTFIICVIIETFYFSQCPDSYFYFLKYPPLTILFSLQLLVRSVLAILRLRCETVEPTELGILR